MTFVNIIIHIHIYTAYAAYENCIEENSIWPAALLHASWMLVKNVKMPLPNNAVSDLHASRILQKGEGRGVGGQRLFHQGDGAF